MNQLINLLFTIVFVIFVISCDRKQPENTIDSEKIRGKEIDSTKDAIFDMDHNGEKWNKNDSASAKFFVKENFLLFSIEAHYKSVTYQNIVFMSLIDRVINNEKYKIENLKDSTLLCTVNYMFAEMDFESSDLLLQDFIGISLTPSLLLTLTKVDTTKNTISGTFRGFVEDNSKKMHKFTNGIFLNIPYQYEIAGVQYQ